MTNLVEMNKARCPECGSDNLTVYEEYVATAEWDGAGQDVMITSDGTVILSGDYETELHDRFDHKVYFQCCNRDCLAEWDINGTVEIID